ncbi:transcriptional regulator [Martiniozyma asiatica (nom. inval.)]|nr:transcriptional regulator [Martiniozyma asiatica]
MDSSTVKKCVFPEFSVWQASINGLTVMRRVDLPLFNASQAARLLTTTASAVDFVELAKRGDCTVVDSGSPELHGIWISRDRLVELASQFQVVHELKPLLEVVDKDGFVTPIKKRSNESHLESPTKKQKTSDFFNYSHDIKLTNPNAPFTFKPVPDTPDNGNSRYILSNLFLPDAKNQTLADLFDGDESQLSQINVDISIDDNGQNALHLAATLGRITLVKELIERGANRLRGDNDGQTALVRALLATNCYELGCFGELLDLLYPAITLVDQRGRTVLHHIAITCGLKGRDDASKYYLATLLEWVVTKGFKIPGELGEQFKLVNFRKSIVNISDKYGNTALNYATFIGDKYLVSQLLDIGADPNKANKIGVKPGDWGIEMTTSQEPNESTPNGSNNIPNQSDQQKILGDSFNSASSLKILNSIQNFISELGQKYNEEINDKMEKIATLNPVFKLKTTQLSQKRQQYDELEKMVRKITGFNNKIENLNKAIKHEEEKFEQEVKELNIQLEDENLGNFDADQPFMINSLYSSIEEQLNKILDSNLPQDSTNEDILRALDQIKFNNISIDSHTIDIPPMDVLNARITAYEKNNENLMARLKEKKKSSHELEQQFKRIIALCIGSDVTKIDDNLLSSLLMSVENEPDPEIGEIKKVLRIVNELGN